MSSKYLLGRIAQLTATPIQETALAGWSPSLEQMRKAYDRYEYVRTLSPVEFADLWQRATGIIPFDDLVDADIAKRAAQRRSGGRDA